MLPPGEIQKTETETGRQTLKCMHAIGKLEKKKILLIHSDVRRHHGSDKTSGQLLG